MVQEDSAELAPGEPSTAAIAAALRPGFDARDLEGMLRAARSLAERDASPAVLRAEAALSLLVSEMQQQLVDIELTSRTVPMKGRRAAAMHLRMANLDKALALYEELLRETGEARVAAFVSALRDLLGWLAPDPAGGDAADDWLDDETRADPDAEPQAAVDRALRERAPAGSTSAASRVPGAGDDEEPPTRVAVPKPWGEERTRAVELDELPLAAFGDDVTTEVPFGSAGEVPFGSAGEVPLGTAGKARSGDGAASEVPAVRVCEVRPIGGDEPSG